MLVGIYKNCSLKKKKNTKDIIIIIINFFFQKRIHLFANQIYGYPCPGSFSECPEQCQKSPEWPGIERGSSDPRVAENPADPADEAEPFVGAEGARAATTAHQPGGTDGTPGRLRRGRFKASQQPSQSGKTQNQSKFN